MTKLRVLGLLLRNLAFPPGGAGYSGVMGLGWRGQAQRSLCCGGGT